MMPASMASVFRYDETQRKKARGLHARSSSPPAPASTPAPAPAASVAPVEIDIDVEVEIEAPPARRRPRSSRTDATVQIQRVVIPPPRRRLGWIVAGAVGVSSVILVAGLVRHAVTSDYDSRTSLAALVAPASPATTTIPTPKPVLTSAAPPIASTSDLRAAPVGTVIGPAGRVYLDGTKLKGTSAIVPCGAHSIRVAPSKKAHQLDVPCGGELKLR